MKQKVEATTSGSNAVYCLGIIGTAIYYIAHATGFWAGVWGVCKAIIWPAFLLYEVYEKLGM